MQGGRVCLDLIGKGFIQMQSLTIQAFCEELDKSQYWHVSKELIDQYSTLFENSKYEHICWALNYHLPLRMNSEKNPFTPAFQFNEGSYPPHFDTLSPLVFENWKYALETLKESLIARARFSDLLLILGPNDDRYEMAKIAFSSYLNILNNFNWDNIYKAVVATRCLSIALQFKQELWVADATKSILNLIEESLKNAEPQPGVVIPLIETLAELNNSHIDPTLIEYTERALACFSSNIYIVDEVILLHSKLLGDAADKVLVAKKRMRHWEGASSDSNGLVSMMHLKRALNIAISAGVHSETQRLRLKIEDQARISPPEMQRIEGKVEISKLEYEKYISSFLYLSDPDKTILSLSLHSPIPLDISKDEAFIREMMTNYPIQHLASVTVLNSNNLPIRNLESFEEKFEYQKAKFNSTRIVLWGTIFHEVISKFLIDPDAISRAFQNLLARSSVLTEFDKDIFNKCFDYYIHGMYDEVIFLALPRIEATLRSLVTSLGVPIFRQPYNNDFGTYITMNGLLAKLSEFSPLSSWNYTSSLLVERFQLNLRNEYLHGLMGAADPIHAGLLIHLIGHLSLLEIKESS